MRRRAAVRAAVPLPPSAPAFTATPTTTTEPFAARLWRLCYPRSSALASLDSARVSTQDDDGAPLRAAASLAALGSRSTPGGGSPCTFAVVCGGTAAASLTTLLALVVYAPVSRRRRSRRRPRRRRRRTCLGTTAAAEPALPPPPPGAPPTPLQDVWHCTLRGSTHASIANRGRLGVVGQPIGDAGTLLHVFDGWEDHHHEWQAPGRGDESASLVFAAQRMHNQGRPGLADGFCDKTINTLHHPTGCKADDGNSYDPPIRIFGHGRGGLVFRPGSSMIKCVNGDDQGGHCHGGCGCRKETRSVEGLEHPGDGCPQARRGINTRATSS